MRNESVDVGQLVTAGQPVGRLFSSAAVEVVVPLSDADAALIPRLWEPGPDAQARVAAHVIAEYGDVGYVWQGHVDRAEPALDAETRTIDVIVRVPGPLTAGIPVGSG